MLRFLIIFICFQIYLVNNSLSASKNFNDWLNDFKIKAVKSGVSKTVVDDVMSNAIFLPKVIEYDISTRVLRRYIYLHKKELVIKS